MTRITPVLLCGGSGTRLWPLSRKSFPKQFARLTGAESLFQSTARRLSGPAFEPPVIVTTGDFRFIVTEQLAAAEIAPQAILIEPSARNTAPAILAAAILLAGHDPQTPMLVAPTDHLIPDADAFAGALAQGLPLAQSGRIVTFGIRPTRAETGYGYLETGAPVTGPATGPVPLRRFVEKPDAARAAEMVAAGNYLWNAGIFLFTAQTIIDAFAAAAPAYLDPVGRAVQGARADLGFTRLAAEPWAAAPEQSVDYAVMEHAANLSVVPFDGHWSDLGGWDAIWRESQQDAPAPGGVVAGARTTAIDCGDVLLRSDAEDVEVVGIGLKDTIVVATGDAVLVAAMDRAQDVRQAVAALKSRGARQAESFPRDHRPWGWFETLALEDRFQVKRIVVHPGASLSLQSHVHRSEHWIVVSGTARVTIDDAVRLVAETSPSMSRWARFTGWKTPARCRW